MGYGLSVKNYINDLCNIVNKTEFAKLTDIALQAVDFNDGIEEIISLIIKQTDANKKVIFIGNGGSAAIASHCTIDFWKNGKMRALCFNEAALLTCIGNDYGYELVFDKPIKMFADKDDILFAISSSGQSKNILNGVDAANTIGAKVITLSGFSKENPLRYKGDYNIYIDSESYGFVELSHQIIIHMILDMIMDIKGRDHKCD